jgi:hypothetical protein
VQVLYGLDFIQKEREQQLGHVRDAVIAHIRDSPDPLLVIEEYDKLDCNTRAFLRQLLQHPELANTTFNRCGHVAICRRLLACALAGGTL